MQYSVHRLLVFCNLRDSHVRDPVNNYLNSVLGSLSAHINARQRFESP